MSKHFKIGGLPELSHITNSKFEQNLEKTLKDRTVVINNRRMPKDLLLTETGAPKMKAMISQPMNGLTADEILETRYKAIKWLGKNGYDLVDTLFRNRWYSTVLFPKIGTENYHLFQLPSSLEQMSKCDVVYFCKGWENYRGCKIEHEAAEAYGLKIIEEV